MRKGQFLRCAVLILVLMLDLSLSEAATITKPLVRIVMSRSELQKTLPRYVKEFASTEPRVLIEHFDLHGMKGGASFLFRDERLLVFMWQYPIGTDPSETDLKKYSKMLRGLRADWGAGTSQASILDPRVQECYWRMPNARAHTSYSTAGLKFQMADSTWLESVKQGRN